MSSVPDVDSAETGWQEAGKKGKEKASDSSNPRVPKEKQVEEVGGIGVIYITDDSSNESQSGLLSAINKPDPEPSKPVVGDVGGSLRNMKDQEDEVFSPPTELIPMVDPNSFLLPPSLEQENVVATSTTLKKLTKKGSWLLPSPTSFTIMMMTMRHGQTVKKTVCLKTKNL